VRTITLAPVPASSSSRDGTTCVLSNNKKDNRGTLTVRAEARTPPKKAGQATTLALISGGLGVLGEYTSNNKNKPLTTLYYGAFTSILPSIEVNAGNAIVKG